MSARAAICAFGAIASIAFAAPACAAEVLDAGTVLVPGGFDRPQPDGNSVILIGRDASAVVDTGRHPEHVTALEKALAGAGKPLRLIVNTHWHLDHTSGNLALTAAHPGVTVLASDAIDGALGGFLANSAASSRAMLADPALDPAIAAELRGDLATIEAGARLRPTRAVQGTMPLPLGGRRIELHLARRAATAGDVWLYDRARRRVIAGDLVTLPVPFLDTACPEGWSRALGAIAATGLRTLVPGHGPVLDRAAFATWRGAYADFVACARGSAPEADCAAGWTQDAARLIPSAQTRMAARMAEAYARQIRHHALDRNCEAAG